MHTSVRRAAVALVGASLLGLFAVPAAAASTAPPRAFGAIARGEPTVAAAGAGWIAREVGSNGAVVDAYSHKANASDTSYAILSLVAAGVGSEQVTSATHWLEHHFAAYVHPSTTDVPGALGLVVLAAVAAGADPTRFGGSTKDDDLVARLEATERRHGSAAGSFGPASSETAFSQSLALLALTAAKVTGPDVELAAAYLEHQQCADGGWEFERPVGAGCARPDPKTYAGPDTNSTSLAVMAIEAAGGSFEHSPLGFFAHSQETNGSFGYYGVSGDGQAGDPDSTGEVVQALIALKAVGDRRFVRSGTTPIKALDRFQYRCGAPASERGEFSYFGAPSQLATLQAVPGAAGEAFPISPGTASSAEPRLSCPAR